MKRLFLIISITLAATLMLIATVKQSTAQHHAQAQEFLSQGMYDEAMQAYVQADQHLYLVNTTIHFLGEWNTFLFILATLFMIAGFLIKSPRSKKRLQHVRIKKEFK